METVHHLQLAPKFFLGEVIKHTGIHQWLHEVGAVLGQTQAGQPFVSHPLVVHVSIGQDLKDGGEVSRVKKTQSPSVYIWDLKNLAHGSDWLFFSGLWNHADAIRSTGGRRGTWGFFFQITCLMHYCQDIMTVL